MSELGHKAARQGFYISQLEVLKLRSALETVRDWKLPDSGVFWDKDTKKDPMSYEDAFGSNGARDYMRKVASDALKR